MLKIFLRYLIFGEAKLSTFRAFSTKPEEDGSTL